MRSATGLIAMAALLWTGVAFAQQPPPPYPPPPYPPPPPPYPPQPYPPQPYPQQPYPQPYPQPYYPQQPYPQQPYPQPAQPPYAPQPDKRLVAEYEVTEHNTGLIAGGLVLFIVSYAVPVIVAGAKGFTNESKWLAIPLFGNLHTMRKRSWDKDSAAIGLGLTLAGLYQHVGVALFTVGVSRTTTRIEREYALVPMLSRDAGGMQLLGSF